ncbi:MAG: PHP domain-containing protein [Candidatus Aminicenantes bacterium]|nr:PHP domain-containing protein [Candidatus Aminicenantes bacterium]
MPGPVDFHIHSNRSSDGDLPPADIVRMARERGFAAISIADHDTVAAYPEAVETGREAGVEVVPSMEVTSLYDGREFHCLLPFLDWTCPAVAGIAGRVTAGRLVEAEERVGNLRRLGFDLSWEEVWAASAGMAPLGVTIARILLEKPGSRDVPALRPYFDGDAVRPRGPSFFYRDYFMDGKPAFVPKRHIPLLDLLDLAPETGGAAVLAHPGAYFQNTTREDLAALRARGLQGVEVYTSYHEDGQIGYYAAAAGDFGLIPTAGSDFHGRVKPHVEFGSIRAGGYWMVEALRERRKGRS